MRGAQIRHLTPMQGTRLAQERCPACVLGKPSCEMARGWPALDLEAEAGPHRSHVRERNRSSFLGITMHDTGLERDTVSGQILGI